MIVNSFIRFRTG